jgi:hypothetical protein
LLQDLHGHTLRFPQQAKQEMLGADERVTELRGFLISEPENVQRAAREPVKRL